MAKPFVNIELQMFSRASLWRVIADPLGGLLFFVEMSQDDLPAAGIAVLEGQPPDDALPFLDDEIFITFLVADRVHLA